MKKLVWDNKRGKALLCAASTCRKVSTISSGGSSNNNNKPFFLPVLH